MYQINFSDQSMTELNKLPMHVQMSLIETFSKLRKTDLSGSREEVGRFEREGRVFFRLREGDYRIYFEQRADTLYAHYVLHRHTLADFIFRMKLPYSEERLFEQDQSFWRYLEKLGRS